MCDLRFNPIAERPLPLLAVMCSSAEFCWMDAPSQLADYWVYCVCPSLPPSLCVCVHH